MAYTTIYNNPKQRAQVIFPYVTWENTFSDEELLKIINDCDNIGTEQSTLLHDNGPVERLRISKTKFHFRDNSNAWIFDKLNFVIQAANEQFYNFHLNGYESFQYTTYDKDGKYDWHTDIHLGSPFQANSPEHRKLSLTVMLNHDFEGGDFEINVQSESNPQKIEKQKGRIVLFPSFMIHRVTPVTKGIRKSLVVWVEGPKFV